MADNPSQPQAADPTVQPSSDPAAEATTSAPEEAQTASAESSAEGSSEQTPTADTTTEASAETETTSSEENSDQSAATTSADSAESTSEPAPDGAAAGTSVDVNTPEGGAPPPPPPANAAPPAPPPEKKKKFLKILIPIIVVMILGGIGGGVSYYLGFWGKKPVESVEIVQAQDTPEATESASVEPTLITPDCVSGYKPYVNKLFSICYPITMDIKEQPATESGVAVTEYIFEDDVETLRVLTDYKDNLNKFDCASSKVVKVATYSAHRYQVKDPNPRGGCAATINEYASLVSAGNDKPIFYVGLTRKQGSYQSDNGAFAAIEQSFRINQP